MLDELEDEMLFLDEVNRSENLTLDSITLEVNDNQSLAQVTIKWEQRGWKWDMREMLAHYRYYSLLKWKKNCWAQIWVKEKNTQGNVSAQCGLSITNDSLQIAQVGILLFYIFYLRPEEKQLYFSTILYLKKLHKTNKKIQIAIILHVLAKSNNLNLNIQRNVKWGQE